MNPMTESETHEQVREYYGKVLGSSKDLKTSACCPVDAIPAHIRPLVANLEAEVMERSYGCGSPIPSALEGRTVLDLGCGTGRDVYIASQLVGESGRAIGIDMTEEQLEVARRHQETHAKRFGHARSNVTFIHGFLEDLAAAGIEDDSIDVVISNCVLNLSPFKGQVFREIFRVLRPGGELYFSDVFVDRRLPEELSRDPVLIGECLGGAMYTEDFRRALEAIGVPDHRVVARSPIALEDPEVHAKAGMAHFLSLTVRAFALDSLEDRCEDYGQVARYLGTIPESPHAFLLDDHHEFLTSKPMPVCGNTAAMLAETRFAPHFRIDGDRSVHHGLFDCGPATSNEAGAAQGACC